MSLIIKGWKHVTGSISAEVLRHERALSLIYKRLLCDPFYKVLQAFTHSPTQNKIFIKQHFLHQFPPKSILFESPSHHLNSPASESVKERLGLTWTEVGFEANMRHGAEGFIGAVI